MSAEPVTAESELREARARVELRALQAREKLLEVAERRLRESAADWWFVGGNARVADQFRTSEGLYLSAYISTAQDRRYGDYSPFWRSWQQHARLRAGARLIYGLSPLCSGAVGGLQSYCIGEGFTYQAMAKKGKRVPSALVEAIQDTIEDFDRRNCWTGRYLEPGQVAQESYEGELFIRSVVDGEALVQEFEPDPGKLIIRPVEPEWVIEPAGMREEVSYGVLTDAEDLLTVNGYWVAIDGNVGNGDEVPPASEGKEGIHFLKLNTPRTVKRGMPDLAYGTHDALRAAGRLLENLAEGASIQAAIALIRQHTQTTKDVVEDFVSGLAEYQRTNPITHNTENVETYRAGKILDVPDTINFSLPQFGANQQAFVPVIQAVLRSIAVKWNAPEWLTSGDASNNNYASSLTAESPFVKRTKAKQRTVYAPFFLGIVWRAVECAARAGQIRTAGFVWDWQQIRQLVDINVTPSTVETRDKLQEAQENQTYVSMGVKSPQTVQAEQGLDPDQEMAQIEEWRRRFGSGGGQMPDQSDQGGGFFGVQEGLLEAEQHTDKRGHKYCVEKGKGRVPCPPGEGEGVSRRKPKEAGPSVEDAVHFATQVSGSPSSAGQLAGILAGMTVAQIRQVKQQLGIRSGGRIKSEMAARLDREVARVITERQRWGRRARAAGHTAKELFATAREMRGIQREYIGEVASMVAEARRMYAAGAGHNLTRNHRAFRGGDLDMIEGFDEIADSLGRQYPHLLDDEAPQRLYDFLAAGPPKMPPRRDGYAEALDYLASQPKKVRRGDAAEPEGGDVEFPFGAQAPGTGEAAEPEGGDTGFEFGANEPAPVPAAPAGEDQWREILSQAGLAPGGVDAVLGQIRALNKRQK